MTRMTRILRDDFGGRTVNFPIRVIRVIRG